MKNIILILVILSSSLIFSYASTPVKYMKNQKELLYTIIGNELFTEKESLKFLKNHTMVYTNLQTKVKTYGRWVEGDDDNGMPTICFTVEKGESGDLGNYVGGICMSLYQMYKKSSTAYLASYKTYLIDNSKKLLDIKYSQDKEFSEQYFTIRSSRNLATHRKAQKDEKKYQDKENIKHNRYLAEHIKKISDIPQNTLYMQKHNLRLKDYISYFGFVNKIKDLTKTNFFKSTQYKYLFNNLKPDVYAQGDRSNFYIRLKYSTMLNYKFNFPVICKSTSVSGGTQKVCSPSKIDIKLIKKYQKYINKVGYANEFSKALKRSVTKDFTPTPKKKEYKYNTTPDYVMINFESVCGFSGCIDKNLQISGGSGNFSPSYNGASSGAIHRGYNGKISGSYNWSAQFDNEICSGSFYLSGNKRNCMINIHRNCYGEHIYEY